MPGEPEQHGAQRLKAAEEGGADLLFGFGRLDADPVQCAVEEVGRPGGPAAVDGGAGGGDVVEFAEFAGDGGAEQEGREEEKGDDEDDGEAGGEAGAA